jgi:hypothetical protein
MPAKCFYPEPAQSSPYPTPHFLNRHLLSTPGTPHWSLSLRFPHQNSIHPCPLPIRATDPAHLILLDLEAPEYEVSPTRITSSLLGPNIFRHPRTSLNVSDQVSHPHKTTGKIIVLYILIFKLLESKLEGKII